MTQVLETYVRIARPSGNDSVGAIEVGFYVVHDGELTLTNEHGAQFLRDVSISDTAPDP